MTKKGNFDTLTVVTKFYPDTKGATPSVLVLIDCNARIFGIASPRRKPILWRTGKDGYTQTLHVPLYV